MIDASSYGLSREHLGEIESVIRNVRRDDQKGGVWLFGSRAVNKHATYSDVDLLIESVPPFSDEQRSRIMFDFEDSDLPYKVDAVYADSIYKPYEETILQQRQLLFTF